MKCNRIRDLIPDKWAGTIEPALDAQFQAHLEECAACRDEFEALKRLWTNLAQVPAEEPGPGVRPRFYAMLEGYQQGLSQAVQGPRRLVPTAWFGWWNTRALQVGFASLLLVMGFLGGLFLRTGGNNREELADLRQEVHEMRRMVSISLLKQESASERLRGVSWSSQINHADPEFLNTLQYTLDHDPSVDVRLAAIDALARFACDQQVRQSLARSLQKQDSPIVQISLIDLLVQLHIRQSAETLQQLANDASKNQEVRKRALWALQLLS